MEGKNMDLLNKIVDWYINSKIFKSHEEVICAVNKKILKALEDCNFDLIDKLIDLNDGLLSNFNEYQEGFCFDID